MTFRTATLVALVAVGVLLAGPGHNVGGAQAVATAFTNVTVIDGTGAPPQPAMTVVVAGGRIAAIGAAGGLRVPDGAVAIDASGKFLIPGLWDMHVHTGGYGDGRILLPRLVAFGVTGVRDMASPLDDVIRLRREVADGTIIGPRMVIAGPILQGPLPFRLPPLARSLEDGEAAAAVTELHSKGVDFIKVGDTLTRTAYLAIAGESRRLGVPFAGHLPVSISAAEAAAAGQRSIEHFGSAGFRGVLIACSADEAALSAVVRDAMSAARAGGASPDATVYRAAFLDRLVRSFDPRKASALFALFVQHDTWQVPTFVALNEVWTAQRRASGAADADAIDRAAVATTAMFGAMRRAGVRVLAGSDQPLRGGVPALHDELVALVAAGMSPMAALQSATSRPAEFLGRLADDGTVEAGKVANLVLLDANPLADIANTRRVAAVVLEGRVLRGAALEALR